MAKKDEIDGTVYVEVNEDSTDGTGCAVEAELVVSGLDGVTLTNVEDISDEAARVITDGVTSVKITLLYDVATSEETTFSFEVVLTDKESEANENLVLDAVDENPTAVEMPLKTVNSVANIIEDVSNVETSYGTLAVVVTVYT